MRMHRVPTGVSEAVDTVRGRLRHVLSNVSRGTILIAVIVVGLGGAAVAADSSQPNQTGTYYGCIGDGNGNLRVIDSGDSCEKNETAITWNQTGPQGLKGDTGAQGPQG